MISATLLVGMIFGVSAQTSGKVQKWHSAVVSETATELYLVV